MPFDIEVYSVEDLGFDERKRRIDTIIGALAMEKWFLTPNPKTGEIDLTALKSVNSQNINSISLIPHTNIKRVNIALLDRNYHYN